MTLPVLHRVRRRVSTAVSPILPFKVTAEVTELKPPSLEAEIRVFYTTAKEGGRGIPFAPISVYMDGVKIYSGRCDKGGSKTLTLSLDKQRVTIDAYYRKAGVLNPSDSIEVLWDNFEDGVISKEIWRTFSTAGPEKGESRIYESDGKLNIYCKGMGHGRGVYTPEAISIDGATIRARLYTDGYLMTGISLTPSDEAWYGPAYSPGYDLCLWEKGIQKVLVYSGYREGKKKGVPYSPSKTLRELPSNPATIEMLQIGEGISFLINGELIHHEEYQPPTKICNIRLWAICFYKGAEGTSWIDNFTFIREE